MARKEFKRQKRALMKVQANVLTRQNRRAYLKLKIDTAKVQAYIKRYLAMSWYARVRDQNEALSNNLRQINQAIGQYNEGAKQLQRQFQGGSSRMPMLDHMSDFEGVQRKAYMNNRPDIQPSIPGLLQKDKDYEQLRRENELLRQQLENGGFAPNQQQRLAPAHGADALEAKLKAELGDQYE